MSDNDAGPDGPEIIERLRTERRRYIRAITEAAPDDADAFIAAFEEHQRRMAEIQRDRAAGRRPKSDP